MERYRNTDGDSGVAAFEVGPNYIRVKFSDDSIYLYTYKKPGAQIVEHMKQLAKKGDGLNAFINTTVRKNYEKKER